MRDIKDTYRWFQWFDDIEYWQDRRQLNVSELYRIDKSEANKTADLRPSVIRMNKIAL